MQKIHNKVFLLFNITKKKNTKVHSSLHHILKEFVWYGNIIHLELKPTLIHSIKAQKVHNLLKFIHFYVSVMLSHLQNKSKRKILIIYLYSSVLTESTMSMCFSFKRHEKQTKYSIALKKLYSTGIREQIDYSYIVYTL